MDVLFKVKSAQARFGEDRHSLKINAAGERVRILVVDDHDAFRQFVSSTLQERPNLEVIGEVQDGLEAVLQAETLQPDLVLLDIGLPKLNGLDAGRQIRQLAPNAQIVFLTQESSADVVQEAFALGARGYVIKVRAGKELLVAIETVLQGKLFVSNGFDGRR